MTQHRVIAEDSLSAMDEISKVLGKDAVILKTQKVNGKIVPQKIQISSFVKGEFITIILEFIRVDYPYSLTIPFKFP